MEAPRNRRPSATGSLHERPLPRLLQQLFRKQLTGCLVIVDQTGDRSEVYLRSGYPVHVHRPVDSDRLDRVLIESGVVSERAVEMADPMVAGGMRLGEALERMGALSRETLAEVLKAQMYRKLTRLFCVSEGSYDIFIEDHAFGEGDELTAMRVDPRSLYYPAIRTAYDLGRVTRELSRLWGQRFRLVATSSPAHLAAMQIPDDDPVVATLRQEWQTLETIDPVATRPQEARAVLLALYYGDILERQSLTAGAPDRPAALAPTTDNLVAVASAGSDENEAAAPLVPEVIATETVPEVIATEATVPEVIAQGPPAQDEPAPAVVTAALAPPPSRPRPPLVPAPPVTPASSRSPSPEIPSKRPASPPPVPITGKARPTGASTPVAPKVEEALRTAIIELAQKLDRLSLFELLEVSESAPAADINAAFFRAARRYHPDRLAGAGLSELAPQAERILARMSEAALTLGDPGKRAAYLAERSGKKTPENTLPSVFEAETLFMRGEALLKKGDHGKAIECLTAACKANPNEPQFRATLAWARFDNPKSRKESVVHEVQRILHEAVTEQPRFARGHYWLGLTWKFLNAPERAERCFREAANLDGDFIEATRELRLYEMRRQRGGSTKAGESPRGGLMSRLFKK